MPPSAPSAGPAWKLRIDERFTALKGCAALTVMLAHYQYIGLLPALPIFKYSGQLAVMLFFFLSSFLLSHSLTKEWRQGTRTMQAVGDYAINRVFRIFPCRSSSSPSVGRGASRTFNLRRRILTLFDPPSRLARPRRRCGRSPSN